MQAPDENMTEVEMVNHPAHYNQYPIEAIELCEELSFNLGSAIKYVWRVGSKPGDDAVEALKKAEWYLVREQARFERYQIECARDPNLGGLGRVIGMSYRANNGYVPPIGIPDYVEKLAFVIAKMKDCAPLLRDVLLLVGDVNDDFSVAIERVREEIRARGGKVEEEDT